MNERIRPSDILAKQINVTVSKLNRLEEQVWPDDTAELYEHHQNIREEQGILIALLNEWNRSTTW